MKRTYWLWRCGQREFSVQQRELELLFKKVGIFMMCATKNIGALMLACGLREFLSLNPSLLERSVSSRRAGAGQSPSPKIIWQPGNGGKNCLVCIRLVLLRSIQQYIQKNNAKKFGGDILILMLYSLGYGLWRNSKDIRCCVNQTRGPAQCHTDLLVQKDINIWTQITRGTS